MLQLQAIRDRKDEIIEALKKRNIDAAPLVQNVLELDEKRRATQSLLDKKLAEANKLSKEIGDAFQRWKGTRSKCT